MYHSILIFDSDVYYTGAPLYHARLKLLHHGKDKETSKMISEL